MYACRWMIETGFFNQKEFFGLGKETRSVDFDNQNAFMCLSALRATILEFHKRLHRDVRTMGRNCQKLSEDNVNRSFGRSSKRTVRQIDRIS